MRARMQPQIERGGESVSPLVSAYVRPRVRVYAYAYVLFDLVVRNSWTCLLLVNHPVAHTFPSSPLHTCVIARDDVVSRYAWFTLPHVRAYIYIRARTRSRVCISRTLGDRSAVQLNRIWSNSGRVCGRLPAAGSADISVAEYFGHIAVEPMRWRRRVRPGFDIATNYSLMLAARGMGFINIRQRLLRYNWLPRHHFAHMVLAGRHVFTISRFV